MSEMPKQQEESQINTKRRDFKSKVRLSLVLLCILVTIIVVALVANISYSDELAAQAICAVDGEAIFPIEEFVCSNENGIYADGILMFGATHLDYVYDMPVVAPKNKFMIAIKPTSLFTACTYSIRLFDQRNDVVYTGDMLNLNDLREMAPAEYYLVIDVQLTRGDEYKHLAYFALIDTESTAAVW